MNNIIGRLDSLIAECVAISYLDELDLNDEVDLISDLGFDSISIINLVVRIEEEFSFYFEDAQIILDNIRNYSWLKNYIIGRSECYGQAENID